MKWDHRRAPWMPSRDRDETFAVLCRLAQRGLCKREIAESLGTNRNSLDCYMRRYGMTMSELKETSL